MNHMIGKSGTGIGKSGTGIGKSGTGARRSGFATAVFATLALACAQPVLAGQHSTVEVHLQGDVLLVSVQDPQGVAIGAAPFSEGIAGYHAVELVALGDQDREIGAASLMVKGSGSGNSGDSVCVPDAALMVKGSGSGNSGDAACPPEASLMVKGSGSGNSGDSACVPDAGLMVKGSGSGNSGDAACPPEASLLVKGSGSGNSGDSACVPDAGLMVKGSGSGNSGDAACPPEASLMVKGSGSGNSGDGACEPAASLMVKGSGSGASGEAAGGCDSPGWGLAEVVVDQQGIHVIIHRVTGAGLEEYLVGFVPASSTESDNSFVGEGNRGFIVVP